MAIITYRRLLTELDNIIFKTTNVGTGNGTGTNEIIYKLITINNGYLIRLIYKNYNIDINYTDNYPHDPPYNINVNSKDIFSIYNTIMKYDSKYNLPKLLNKSICYNSILCRNNWCCKYTISDILDEVENMIRLSKIICYQKLLLSKIINKFTNESMDYLYQYL